MKFLKWFWREDSSAEQKKETLKAPNRSSLELVEEYALGNNLYQIFRIHDSKYIVNDFGVAYYRNGNFLFMANDISFAPVSGDVPVLVKVLIKDHSLEWNYFQGLFTLDGVFVAPIYRTRYYDTISDLAWEHFRITVVFDFDVLSLLEKDTKSCAVKGGVMNVPALMADFAENTQPTFSSRLSTLDFYESNWRYWSELAPDEYICEEFEHWSIIYRKNDKYYYKYKDASEKWNVIYSNADYMTFIKNPFGRGVLLKVVQDGTEKLYKYPYHNKEQVGNTVFCGGGNLRCYRRQAKVV